MSMAVSTKSAAVIAPPLRAFAVLVISGSLRKPLVSRKVSVPAGWPAMSLMLVLLAVSVSPSMTTCSMISEPLT